MRRLGALGLLLVGAGLAGCSGSSGGACGQVDPCGGDVVGSWSIVGSCLSPEGMFSSERQALFAGFCTKGGASAVEGDHQTASWVGAWSFAETMSYSVSILATVDESFTCTDGETCGALDAELTTAESTYPTLQAAGCTGSAGSCACTVQWASFNADSGTYAASGTALSLAATTGVPTAQIGYCVQGNTMHWIPTASVSAGPPFPDIVAVRQ
ncbi:MAG TPA: hypothetical protein VKZ18_28225 [Polyangia bacterium]|nr:hypothetical protein [Polyangia bacterium]